MNSDKAGVVRPSGGYSHKVLWTAPKALHRRLPSTTRAALHIPHYHSLSWAATVQAAKHVQHNGMPSTPWKFILAAPSYLWLWLSWLVSMDNHSGSSLMPAALVPCIPCGICIVMKGGYCPQAMLHEVRPQGAPLACGLVSLECCSRGD